MKRILLAGLLFLGAANAAHAKPQPLSDKQLARVVAGFIAEPVGPTRAPPPIWNQPPPIVNPGGPILISCVVNVGCTARHP